MSKRRKSLVINTLKITDKIPLMLKYFFNFKMPLSVVIRLHKTKQKIYTACIYIGEIHQKLTTNSHTLHPR